MRKNTRQKKPSFQLKPACAAVLLAFSIHNAAANPLGGSVVNGQASFNSIGNTLTVTNTPGTIIHWNDFSIQQNEITRFAQQSASSAVLNRVITNNPSLILGSLQSNGRVFLVNPSGIVFGAGSTVDVAGLVATSLNLSDADFQTGRMNFSQVPGAQAVSNAGNISAQQGGEIYLIAPNVDNSGVITAPNGEILLAAGNSIELVNSLDPNLRVNITAPAGDATNVGQLVASAGNLGLFGAVVRNTGTVSADSAILQGGKIVFRSSQRTDISGSVSATGISGGSIEVLSNNEVLINAGATLDASGANGGGTILVGGDKQGKNPDVINAKTTTVDTTASIKADGGIPSPTGGGLGWGNTFGIGNGGKIIVWANDITRAYGSLSAKGGANGGNGGFIETSAHYLDVAGIQVNASAPQGKAGDWLLDPANVTIQGASDVGGSFIINTWTPSTSTSFVSTGTILSALTGGTTVTILTAGPTGGTGDITLNASITKTTGTAANLILLADRDIIFASGVGISSNSGAVNVTLRADADANGTGTVSFTGTNTLNALNGGRVDIYYNPVDPNSYAVPTVFTNITWGATAHTEWMLVNDVTHLQLMNTNLAGTYALGANIDATAISFVSVGNISTKFTGMFDGLGHTIDGLNGGGLFGETNASTIKNVTLSNVNITGGDYVGALVGWHQGTLSNSQVLSGTVTGTGFYGYVGGMVGMNYNGSIVTNCSSGSAVSGINYVGGLIGGSQLSTLTNVSATGNVTGTNVRVGGLVGDSWNTSITNGTANGNVVGVSAVGGLVGYNEGYFGSITLSSASGIVSGTQDVGGLVGFNSSSIGSSNASGAVIGSSGVGGLVGNNYYSYDSYYLINTYGSVTNSSATGNVTGISNVGGLVGYNYLYDTISTSNAGGAVSGLSNVGGLVGINDRGFISTSFATGTVVTPSNANSVSIGGLVGDNSGTITDSYVTTANVTGYMYVGGLVGNNWLYSGYSNSITNSYVSGGSVTGLVSMGGLVGNNAGTVTNSHYNINGVLINNANIVTLGGLYNDQLNVNGSGQYDAWRNNGFSLNIADYATLAGSVSNFSISTVKGMKDMLGFTDNYLNTFTLTGNVDLATLPGFYVPIMASSFNGAGFTISNLSVNLDTSNLGLFGVVDSLSTVSNVSLLNVTVRSNGLIKGDNIGGLAGVNKGTINSSSVSTTNAGNTLVVGGNNVGGLVGNNSGAIYTSRFSADSGGTASVTGNLNVGGLVGAHFGLFLNQSGVSVISNGVVNVSGISDVGGLVGALIGNIDQDYVSSAVITASGQNIGGLAGSNNANIIYSGSKSYFNVDAVKTNGGNNGTAGGLYSAQYNDWYNGGSFTPLVIGNYASLVLQGDGSYGISDLQGMKDMLGFADYSLNNFSLTANVDLITLPGFYIPLLAGSFNGNNFSISNLSINLPNNDMGLFGNINFNSSVVSNLNLVNANVSGITNVGALAGINYGTIDNVSVTGTSTVGALISTNVGGLVGYNNHGNISNSDVDGATVRGAATVGGLVGMNSGSWSSSSGTYNGIISNSFVSNGTVTGTAGNIGGLVGYNWDGAIIDSHVSNPTVNGGASSSVGGLVGYNRGGATGSTGSSLSAVYYGNISSSYVSGGTVSSTGNKVGGLAGYLFGSQIAGSWVDGVSVTGGLDVGGLVGFDSGEGSRPRVGVVSNSHALNTQVTGHSHVGGLVGYLGITSGFSNVRDSNVVVTSSYVSGGTVTSNATTSSASAIGGLVGYNFESNISGSYVTNGTVVNSGVADSVGGLVGHNIGFGTLYGRIVGSYVNGVVVGTTATTGSVTHVGGLVGFNSGTISNSYVSGGTVGVGTSAAWLYNVGGLVGSNNLGSIDTSYVTGGTVSGYSAIGGLAGYNNGTINQSYAASGTVSIGSGFSTGGLVGNNNFSGSVVDSFWDVSTTGLGGGFGSDFGNQNTVNVMGFTTAQMMLQSNLSPWDFTVTGPWWSADTYTRPFLRSEWSTTITNAHQLQLMDMNPTASYTLANNIDMAPALAAGGMWNSTKGFVPVGNMNSQFMGQFNGQNFTISNLKITRTDTSVGLFGEVGSQASISNLALINSSVAGASIVGGLVGNNFGIISNGYVTNSQVSGISRNGVGGLVGQNWATINNSFVSGGSVNAGGWTAGGLVGENLGTITGSYVTGGTVVSGGGTSSGGGVGGLVGNNNTGTVSGSYVSGGTVTSINAGAAGGLAGRSFGGEIGGSYVGSVSVTGDTDVGGLVGNNRSIIRNSYVTGSTILGVTNVGGLVGNNASRSNTTPSSYLGNISNTYVSGGTVTGNTNAGGLVGFNDSFNGAMVSGSFWNLATTGGPTFGIGFDSGLSAGTDTEAKHLTAAQMHQQSSFNSWNIATPNTISSTGGSRATWRIYEGHTAPLLTSFMQILTLTDAPDVTVPYDGSTHSGSAITTPIVGVLGAAASGTLAGFYNGYYSDQLGYDIVGGNLTISGVSVSVVSLNGTRAYDGSVNVAANIFVLSGLVNNETLTLSGFGTIANKNVGTYSVALGSLDLGSLALGDGTGLASNYTFTGGTFSATITAAPLTVSAIAVDRAYDATTNASVSFADNRIAGDVFTTGYGSASFVDKNAGTAKQVNVTGITLVGTDARNYTFNTSAMTAASITQRDISITANSATKEYGTADPTFTYAASGLVGSDALSGALVRVAGENVVEGGYAITQGSLANSNYRITGFTENQLTITRALLTVQANSLNKFLGTTDPLLTYMVSGLRLNDTEASTLSGALDRDSGDIIGSYSITQGALALQSTNYRMNYVPGTFRILAPTVVQELTQASLMMGTPEADQRAQRDKKEETEEAANLAAIAENTVGQGGGLAEPLPVCR